MTEPNNIGNLLSASGNKGKGEEALSLEAYFKLCKDDSSAYATVHERFLKALGEPEIVETKGDPRLSRIFRNKTIARYKAFEDFKGMETTLMDVVSFFKKAAQGLEERKQVLFFMGPVGTAKSSLAARIVELIQKEPIYVLRDKQTKQLSPVNESPLGIATKNEQIAELLSSDEYKIPKARLKYIMSPWAEKRLRDAGEDFNAAFDVVKVYPSAARNLAVSRVEAKDRNMQDVSDLLGKMDLSKIELLSSGDPDAYAYTGGLCRGNRGVMEFVEMLKSDISVLNPMLSATQDRQFAGLENIGAIPFEGVIVAHTNESEWLKFKGDKKNEALLDRICVVKVPYSLRLDDEVKIYQKYIAESEISKKVHIAPQTLETLAKFSILTRLEEVENSPLISKLRVYNGEDLSETDLKAKPLEEYRQAASSNEGMSGMSSREAFKTLSDAFNSSADKKEPSANPVSLLKTLAERVAKSDMGEETQKKYQTIVEALEQEYFQYLEREIKKAYFDDSDGYAQNMFDRYFNYADSWLNKNSYVDTEIQEEMNLDKLNDWMEGIEKPAGVANARDFRNDFVRFVLRYKADNNNEMPKWNANNKVAKVLEKKVFSKVDDILPIISFTGKLADKEKRHHTRYVDAMVKNGYSKEDVRVLTGWYGAKKKA